MRGIKFLLKEENLGFFPPWEKIFKRKAFLYFEIGVGNGEFIVEMAKKMRDVNFVGVEISKEVLRKALSRVEECSISNVRLIYMEGTKALAKLFKSESLDGVFLNFPDPWPKKKHQKKRIVNSGFLYLLLDRLKIDGFFKMVTDHVEYAEETVKLLRGLKGFSPLWEEYLTTNREAFFPTKYARKWLYQGKRIYFIGVKKTKKITLPEWVKEWCPLLKIREEEIALPIVNIFKIEPKLIFSEFIHTLKGCILHTSEKLFIKILDTFYNDETLLLDLLVKEGIINQRFFVKISPYGKGDYILTPYDSRDIDPTEGVHLALVLVLKKIKEFSQHFELIKSTCKDKFLKAHLSQL